MTERLITAIPAAPAFLILMVVLMAGSLAANADDTPKQLATSNDPFSVYDAQLNDVAFKVLHDVTQPPPAAVDSTNSAKSAESERQLTNDKPRSSLSRVEQLRPVIDPILREVGVPTELAAVVLVESGGQPTALSPKGARGLWQLMPDTARRYGLVVNQDRDDRLDVMKSTRAAAEYLRDLYGEFHQWPLALAAYNAGGQAVERAISKTGAKAFSVVRQALPRETRNYVPAVLTFLSLFRKPEDGIRRVKYEASEQVVYAAAMD